MASKQPSIAKEDRRVYRGASVDIPFLILMVIAIVLIMVFPSIALWFPDYVNGKVVGPVDWLIAHCGWFKDLCASSFHYVLP